VASDMAAMGRLDTRPTAGPPASMIPADGSRTVRLPIAGAMPRPPSPRSKTDQLCPATASAPSQGAAVAKTDFDRIELRVAEVLAAEAVPKSKKLLKLTVSLGAEPRTIVAGIAQHYAPADLVGKKVVVVANLEPAKLMGIQSQGMVLAGSTEDDGALAVLVLDRDLPTGARVR